MGSHDDGSPPGEHNPMTVSRNSTLDDSAPRPEPPSAGVDAAAMKAAIAGELFGDIALPLRIGRYEVREQLGRGGMGVVYAAWDASLQRNVALKLVSGGAGTNERRRARMIREAQSLAKLSHPNVVHVYEVGEQEDQVFVAMELVDGFSLRDWLDARPRTRRELEDVFAQAAEGLTAAHRAGLVHRDFKPTNVLVGRDGRVRVVDFGLAHGKGLSTESAESDSGPSPERLTQTGAVMGTPAYMAPEQFRGAVPDARADQFAFCVALFEALCGERPYHHADLRDAPGRAQLRSWSSVPRLWRGPLRRGLAISPSDRWPSVLAVVHAHRNARRRWRFVPVAAVSLAALSVLAALFPDADSCSTVPTALAGWDEARAAEIGRRFGATKAAYAGDVWASANEQLSEFSRSWHDTRATACAHAHGTATHDCLVRAETVFRAVVDEYAQVDASNVGTIHALATLLEQPAACLQEHPNAFSENVGVTHLNSISRARAELTAGRHQASLTTLAGLLRSSALEQTEALSEIHRLRGEALAQLSKDQAAAEALALAQATAHGTRARVRSLSMWVRLLVERERFESAADGLTLLKTLVTEGSPPNVRADVLELDGFLLPTADRIQRLHAALELRLRVGNTAATSRTRMALANALSESNDAEQLAGAEALYRDELSERRTSLGTTHPEYAVALYNLGVFLADERQDWERSADLLMKADAIERRTMDAKTLGRARTRLKLGEVLIRIGRTDEAKTMLDAAWARLESAPATHSDHIAARSLLAQVALANGDHRTSVEHHKALAEIRPDDPFIQQNIAHSSAQLDDAESARLAVARARALAKDASMPESVVTLLDFYFRTIDAQVARIEGRTQDALAIVDEIEREALDFDPGDDATLQLQLDALQPELDTLREQLSD